MSFQDLDNSIVLLDKPEGITSAGLLNKVKKITRYKKIGHSGTLDKAASGLLVIGIGAATKLMRYFLESKKKYLVSLRLGIITDSHDRDGQVLETRIVRGISASLIEEVIMSFKGNINQRPPLYSALKIKGQRASDLARSGKDVKLKERKVSIYNIEIDNIDLSKKIVEFKVECSKGTYIRSLVRDIGDKLKCGASLLSLRREELCDFFIKNAVTIEELSEFINQKKINKKFFYTPFEALAHMNRVVVNKEASSWVVNGRFFQEDQVISITREKQDYYIIVDEKNNLLAIADIDIDNWHIKYLNVFNI